MKHTARAVVLALTAALAVLAPGTAHAADPNDTLLAYDAPCVLAVQHLHGPTAQRCRAHGWTVTRHAAIDPQHRLRWTNVKACRGKARPCLATAGRLDNARVNTGLYRTRHHAQRVRLLVWRDAITPEMGLDTFAPTARDWTACTYLTGQGALGGLYGSDSVVLCPDGHGFGIGHAYQPGDYIPHPGGPMEDAAPPYVAAF